ncbi:MAG: HD domain-containing phosphohydrolase, partial [Proteocatella sp.]
KMHPSIGANLLEEIDSYKDIALNIRHHHERWDGSGYPDKLTENQIPVGSQLIAIADTYDAIISDRIYRKSRTKSDAVDILRNERWKQFNGNFVDLFIDNIL